MKLLILTIATGLIANAQSTTYGLVNVGKTDISRGAVVLPGATFGSPPSSPATHDTYRFTDATSLGTCTGGGSAIALCEWSGSAWVAISGGSGGGGGGTVNSVTAGSCLIGSGTSTDPIIGAETTNCLLTKATAQAGQWNLCSSSAGSSTHVCSLPNALTGYSTGMVIQFKPTVTAVTGAATVAIDGLAAKAIKKADGTTDPGSDVAIGQQVPLTFDGTVWRLPATGSSSTTYTPLPASGAGLLPFIPKIGLSQIPTNAVFGDAANTVYGFAFQTPPGGMTVANLAIEVITAAPSGGRLRIKIVNQAGTVLADSGAITTAIETTGVKSAAFTQVTIPEGVYSIQYAASDISTLTTRNFYFIPTYRIDSPTTGLATGYKLFGSMGVSASGAGAAYNFTAQALSAMTNDNGLGYVPIFAFWK